MLVRQMLVNKGGAARVAPGQIVTIDPEATIEEAARLLYEHRIGAIVASADGRIPEGILSERDIVRELGHQGHDVLGRKVREVMTSRLATCQTGDDAMSVLERMTAGRFRHLPVVDDDGQMIGIISIGDVVGSRLSQLSAEKEALTGMIMGA